MSKRFFWSYTDSTQYDKCKKAYEYKKVIGFKTKSTYLQSEGHRVHTLCENWLKGNIKGFPGEMGMFRDGFKELKKLEAEPEIDLTVDINWEPTETTDWDNAWLRGAADVAAWDGERGVLMLKDFKWGNNYPEHKDQGHIYATLGFCHYDVEEIEVEFWYLKTGERAHLQTYNVKDHKKMIDKWNRKVRKMQNTKTFPMTSNKANCRWCSFSKKRPMPA